MSSNAWFSFLLLLVTLFFGSLGLRAQTIDNVAVTGTPVCKPGSIQISFRVTNGNGNGNYFTSNTKYTFSLRTLNGTDFTEVHTANTPLTGVPGPTPNQGNSLNGASNIISNIDFKIPSTVQNGSNYRILISSTDPIAGQNIQAISAIFVISSPPNAPTTTGALICIGSTAATLSASGAVAGERYLWYNASTGGSPLKTSANNTDNTYTTPVLSATTNYWVSILNSNGCESTRSQVAATFPGNSPDSQTTAGTNTWIGHVYDGTNLGVAFNENFTNYFGTYIEAETFDQSFGGTNTCFPITSSLGNRSILTESFSVRYRMNLTSKKGLYVVDLGSDDGRRLAVDGTLVYNNWSDQGGSLKPAVLMNFTGNSQLVYDYYENGGGNRVTFNNLTRILENNLTANTNQTICASTTAAAISGDTFGTLPAGISGAGYQWTYSTSPEGIRNDITGATSASFTPNGNVAPFNNPGTYYIFRNASLSSNNNLDPNPYVATNESNFVVLKVNGLSEGQGEGQGQGEGVNLGTAGNFTILSKSGITNVFESYVKGDVGSSPITGAAILLTCSEVEGTIYSVDPAGPVPCRITDASRLTTAVLDMQDAYVDAAGRSNPDFLDLGAGNIGGKTLTPGLYKFNSVVTIPTDITLSGGPNDIWIFQIAGTFNLSTATKILLAGGAQAKNIFWQISGAVTLGTYSHFEGNIIGKTSIHMLTGATINGRLLAQTAVTLQMNTINGLGSPETGSPAIQNNIISNDQTVCEGSNAQLLNGTNVTGGNGTYTYLWESSITSNSEGFSPAEGTNDTPDYDPETLSQSTWFRRTVTSGSCVWDISNVIEITLNQPLSNNQLSFSNGISGTLCATANENGVVNLSAPAETIFNYVNFASYGTPEGNCGNFTIDSNCHALTSQTVAETNLLGNNTANIDATNDVFGNPCVETVKRLYVQASYSQPICIGTDPGTILGTIPTGGDGNYTYVWESSITGPNSGFTAASGANTLQNLNPGILTTTTWFKRTVTSLNCTNESPVLLIQVKQDNIWTGVTNSDWNTASNWSCNTLPSLETNVLIPASLVSNNYPEINAGTNALAKNLSIEDGASVLVNENWLRIAGDLTNSGVLNTATGSISFEGTSAQNIPAAAFQNNRIRNLRIDNTSGVTSEAIIEVTGELLVRNGNFNAGNDQLTLVSNATQTALIDGSGSGQVVGTVKMQRYLDVAFGYKYFSSPFQNSVVADFEPFMDLTNPSTGFPNSYRYNEERNVSINETVEDATGWDVHTGALNIAEGYALNFGDINNTVLVEITGEVNNGPIAARTLLNNHREYTRGFHLVGNPYPSPIDWNAGIGWTRENLDNAIYFFKASESSQYTGSYTSYVNEVSTEDPLVDGRSSNIIPSMQGFFIKVNTSETEDLVTGTFGMDNRVRTKDFNQAFLKAPGRDPKQLLRFTAGFTGENKKDAMIIYFSPFSTLNFEKEFDAYKLMNSDPAIPNFYNITPNKKELAINAIPFPVSGNYNKIPLGIKAEKSGKMSIALSSMENLSSNFNIYLIDHSRSIGQNLSQKPEYTFDITEGIHNSRFELMFSEEKVTNPAIAFNEPFHVEVINNEVVVKLNLEDNQEGILQASTMIGQILQIKKGRGKEHIVFNGITSDGVYIINLILGEARYSKKVIIKK